MDVAAELCKGKTIIPEHMVSGLCYIDECADVPLSDKKLRQRIIDTGYVKIEEGILGARSYFKTGSAPVFARGILDVVNKGLQNKYMLNAK
jgi:hypothetical protein